MSNAELIKALRYCGNFANRDGCDEECPYFNEKDCPNRIMCDAADAIEAQIPKEGVWQGIIIDGQYWAITCSNCHQVGFNARTPYCPNCGARMKKGDQLE